MLRRRPSLVSPAAPAAPANPASAGAAVRALRGEEVLVWTSGTEQPPSDSAPNPRKRLLRRGPAPGVPALLVATRARRGGALRIHLLAEVGQAARTWALADLRLVDGLGLPVRESTTFALTFAAATRPLIWRCESPPKRAVFLWTLLQVCAARLQSRAPPSQRLSLLDLQTFAREVTAKVPPPSAAAAAPGKPAPAERDTAPLQPPDNPARVVRTASEPQPAALHRLTRRTATSDSRRSADHAPAADRDLTIHERAFLLEATRLGAGPDDFPARSRPQSPLPAPRPELPDGPRSSTTVTAESPLPGPSPPPPQPQQPQQPQMPRRPSGSSLRKGLAMRDGASPTELLVARVKAQEERRQFRLDAADTADLAHALRLFDADAAPGPASPTALCDFADWTRARVQAIEATNMADTVQIELHPQRSAVARFRRALVGSVAGAEPWLGPAEARLAPYAALIDDIRARAAMLDVHRAHAAALRDRLQQLLEHALWTPAEEAAVADALERAREAPAALASDDALVFDTLLPAAEALAAKLTEAPDERLFAEIAGLADARADMLARRDALVALLEPALAQRAGRPREGTGAPYPACSSSLSLSLVSGVSTSPTKGVRGAPEKSDAHARLAAALTALDPHAGARVIAAYQEDAGTLSFC